MNDGLDIGASIRRHEAEGDADADHEDTGEAAWDLADSGATGASAGAASRTSPPPATDRDADPKTSNNFGVIDPQRDKPNSKRGDQLDLELDDERDAAAPAFPAFPGFGDEEDEAPTGPRLDIGRFVRGVWKRRWIVAAISAIVTLLFLVLALMIEREWRATATLITQTHQDQFQIGEVPPFKPQSYDIKTFIDTIKLPSSLDKTMELVGVDVLRRTMAAAIDIGIGNDSKIFSISANWDDPNMAARIANTVAELFIENSARINRKDADENFNYYSAQLREARIEQQKVNAELLAFEEANQISSLQDEVAVLVSQVSALDGEYRTKVAEAGAMRAAQRRITAQVEKEPEMVVAIARYRSPFKQRLSDYQWELKEARTRYTDENPKIQRLQKRIQTLEQLIAESNDEVAPENEYRLNPKREDLSLRGQELEDEIKVVEAQANALRGTLDESRAKLDRLTIARNGYLELTARLADADRLVNKLAARVAEIRVVMLRNDSGFSMLERATAPNLPEPSMRKLVAAAGVILGGGLGLFVALVLEFLDPLVRTARDAQGITGCNLVLEFQQAPHEDDALIDHGVPTAPVSVLFRRILNDLDTALEPKQWRSLAITSAEPTSGRSLIAINLASALGLKDEMTLVVDADVRADAGVRPSAILGIEALHPAETITEVLMGAAAPQEAFEPTTNPFVRLLSAGDYHNDNGLLLLGSKGFKDLAQKFDRERMHVLYDLPPFQAMESVAEAAAAVGNVMLVVRSGHTRRSDLKQISETLKAREIEIRAVIVTMIPRELLTKKPAFEQSAQEPRFRRKRRDGGADDERGRIVIGDDVPII